MKLTKKERECRDMADVCELAHERTVRECKRRNIQVDCTGIELCGDEGQDHDDPDCTHYTRDAQKIFDAYYDEIIEKTGL